MDSNFIGLVAVVLGGLTVLIPVAAFATRFAVKPVLEMYLKARAEQHEDSADIALLEKRMAFLEQQIEVMGGDVGRLLEEREFDRRLLEKNP